MSFMVAGAALVASGATDIGRRTSGASTRWLSKTRRHAERDQVTVESMDSFPASDAPSSNAAITSMKVNR
jgi:hypothetical protein